MSMLNYNTVESIDLFQYKSYLGKNAWVPSKGLSGRYSIWKKHIRSIEYTIKVPVKQLQTNYAMLLYQSIQLLARIQNINIQELIAVIKKEPQNTLRVIKKKPKRAPSALEKKDTLPHAERIAIYVRKSTAVMMREYALKHQVTVHHALELLLKDK